MAGGKVFNVSLMSLPTQTHRILVYVKVQPFISHSCIACWVEKHDKLLHVGTPAAPTIPENSPHCGSCHGQDCSAGIKTNWLLSSDTRQPAPCKSTLPALLFFPQRDLCATGDIQAEIISLAG